VGTELIFSSAYAETTLSPLKQIQSGIQPQDVKCKADLVLVIRPESISPACVTSTTSTRLLLQGWITPEKFMMLHTNQKKLETVNEAAYNNKNSSAFSQNTDSTNHTSNVLLFNHISNATNTIDQTINETYIYKLYQESYVNGTVPQLAQAFVKPLPELKVNYTESSTEPNIIKILFIGMTPNQLKVGGIPVFTFTYQNISNKTYYGVVGCSISILGVTIIPQDDVTVGFPMERLPTCSVSSGPLLHPNQIDTERGYPNPFIQDETTLHLFSYGFYQIMKPDLLHVTLTLLLSEDSTGKHPFVETVQFNVNATQ
jgi:hypothetical protein